ncbi:uncharacterized protein LOC132703316 isoform X2 [Cylas formicarius]|uniref:uncharacterized protein LOC132703316 isoform X2 n=1 Tax=Cylas formicarius TaxID=197179 RepID=UPI00295883F7|nr:uncharacterized protein LOC132703316 isoform X2 [Cylas formicarius]
MMSGGIWMLDESKRSLAFVIFYRFYSMAFPVYCASMATSLAIEIPNLISESSTAVMENVARALVVAIVVTKLVMCKKKRIVDLFEAASKQFAEIAGNADPEIIKILQQHVEYWKKILLVLVVPVIFGYLLLCEMGIENTIRFDWLSKPPNVSLNAPLPSNFWYPFDKNAYHHWLLLDQCLRVGGITTGMNSVAAMINSLMVFMRLQIKLLQHHFRNFDKYGGGPEDLRWCDGGGTSKLRLLCRRHQELIAYVEKFNEALKYIILLEYTSSSIMFAGAIFQIVSVVSGGKSSLRVFFHGVQLRTADDLLVELQRNPHRERGIGNSAFRKRLVLVESRDEDTDPHYDGQIPTASHTDRGSFRIHDAGSWNVSKLLLRFGDGNQQRIDSVSPNPLGTWVLSRAFEKGRQFSFII